MSIEINLPEMHPVSGFKLGTACAGIKLAEHKDVVIMSFPATANVAGVFTQNAFCAAPVHIAKTHLQEAQAQYFIVNTGNANAGTGEQGMADALATCEQLGKITGTGENSVLPFSTGVIGETLPVNKIISALPDALNNLSEQGWKEAAQGILTTDTCTKGASTQVSIAGEWVTITGISKGSGMIRPDMATMLGFVATDAAIEPMLLQTMLKYGADHSFNRITVDGDTSTNDSCMLVATGCSKAPLITNDDHPDYQTLLTAVTDVLEQLAKAIVLDGEGATKLINIKVKAGKTEQECQNVAYTIAHSPLVKTAFFSSDPNWGRILAAVGRSGINDFDINALEVYLDEVCLVRQGGRADDYTEARGQSVMDQDEITVTVDLQRGLAETQIWTCDLSYDYVKINAEYRT
ncbi:MAG: bifunctional glutamate N-acetyltransferase/amino-acid acetyltransferase ArgJ [gamma proteobacterium symbiont of Bathyaustriella thionipta]|nr:bifunctional glutamate N-acetyltransferase/amino-acid acetyltransferase ArgJ [gamma proteobacterium symbiont of Bathyaustriella thionipta]MCU7950184.1 bifunctional glutamate N-acetyltransferase/amino-acid acetyltransferase ArgJ [gamma proteobacterium symbiont of Bathyaustriella thionipta]MCU7953894.1 bifunctional glutamate N-acetyltransferase/amino-acid acetyltransferase ArgJ [gamma proteobacterium symbiont of Bathyaustriella thionipta]MCU7955010.1 bifunctional glutamate N-acetyltransferase/a